jgi:hypothetical protein
MYVPTSLLWPERFLPYDGYPANIYFKWQRELVDLFSKYDEQFLVKLPYKEGVKNPLSDYIQDKGIKNCRVLTVPLTEILHIADLFIIDYPSTALLQALTTDKKVVLFTHLLYQPLFPKALEVLKKRVLFSNDYEEFLKIVSDVLERKDFSPLKNPDEEFMREYGNCLVDDNNGKKAAKRIVAEILQKMHLK